MHEINRREFLKIIGSVAGGAFLSSCTSILNEKEKIETIPSITPTTTIHPYTETPEPTPTLTPEPTLELLPEKKIKKLQNQLEQNGLKTEIKENESGEYLFEDINGSSRVEIGKFKMENGEYVFEVVKTNGENISYPIDALGIDEEDNRFVIKGEDGEVNFRYYPELRKLRQEIEFPYITLTTNSGRVSIVIGESLEGDIQYAEWNNNLPPLEYTDPETGEIKSLSTQERYDEAVAVSLWSLASLNGLNPGVTLEDIRQGTLIKYKNSGGEIVTVDTGKPVKFVISTSYQGKSEERVHTGNYADKLWVGVDKQNRLIVTFGDSNFDFWAQYDIRHEDWVKGPMFNVFNSLYYRKTL